MKAVYAAFFRLDRSRDVEVGALGRREFEPGFYVYTGSAMNSVEKRLERHFSSVENKHWHIDYFSSVAEPVDYLVIPADSRFECELAQAVSRTGRPVQGFGCSDCSCGSHLFHFSSRES